MSTRVSTTIHVHRELLSQLDLILAERTEAARMATGSTPRLTRADLIEEACWRLVQDQIVRPFKRKTRSTWAD